MKTHQGNLKVIEFNARLGDPEGIPLLETMETDFFDVCYHITHKTLEKINVTFNIIRDPNTLRSVEVNIGE